MKASNLNLPKPSLPPLNINSPENAVVAAEGKFTSRLRRIGQTLATLAYRILPTARDLLPGIKNSILAMMLNSLKAIDNYFSDAFNKTLSRSSFSPPAKPCQFTLDETARDTAEKIIDEFAIPL